MGGGWDGEGRDADGDGWLGGGDGVGAGDSEVGLRGGEGVEWVGRGGEGDGFLTIREILAGGILGL